MGLHHTTATFVILLIVGAIKEIASSGPQLMISTSPSGPVYPAATWVRVACRYNHSQPYLLQYRWTGSCNSTGAAVFDIDEPLLDEQGWAVIWVKTTPVNCLDRFHCTVYEREQNGVLLTEIASEVFIFQHVSGVGISLPDDIFLGSLPNNSAVVFQGSTHQEVICHSARRSSCVSGHWTSAADTAIAIGSCDDPTAAAEVTFNSVRLDLSTVSEEGIYSCVVNDERGVEQKLFIGVYLSVPMLTLEQRHHVTTDGLVVLECDTRGLPSTATLWSRNGALLDVLAADTKVLSDYQSTLYRNSLALSGDMVGVVSCDVYSDWVTSDKRNSGRQSIAGFFVIAPLSESTGLECAFPEGTTNVEWLGDLSTLQPISRSTQRNNTALISLILTEEVHGQTFVCRGRDVQGRQLEKHYMILAQVPDDTLSMRIKYPPTEPTAHQPLLLQCCASHTNQGIPSQPALQWYKDGHLLTGKMTSSSIGEQERCLAIEFLQERHEGEYTCRATLLSSRMEVFLVKEESFELSLEQLFTTTDSTTDYTEEEETPEELQATILIITLLSGVCISIGLVLVFLVCMKAHGSCKKADMFDTIMEEAGKIVSTRKAKEEEAAAEAEIARAEIEKERPTTPTT